jgi:amino-acid N-acetyltransferase
MNSNATSADIKFGIANGSDKKTVRVFLQEVKLPTESVDTGVTTFYVGTEKGDVVGIAGFEFYGDDALLRSVAVRPKLQSRGIGSRTVDHMLSVAKQRNMRRVVLLTETAQKFFERKGFKVVDRSSIMNGAMLKSSEFTVACPKSAVCMVLELDAQA